MSQRRSREVISNQTGSHERLEATVLRHLNTPSRKPIADHTRLAHEGMCKWLEAGDGPLILDACCGVGDSSRQLARTFPAHRVIGIDKSLKRLSTEREPIDPDNLLLLRADLNDFYRLAVQNGLVFERHYILYPNPWPKAAHLGRRWHGAPAFKDIVRLGGRLELRSNWKLYLEEFQIALEIAGFESKLVAYEPDSYVTPFEAKYHTSGQALWQLVADL